MTKPSWMSAVIDDTAVDGVQNVTGEKVTASIKAFNEKEKSVSTFELACIDEVPGVRVMVSGKVKKGDTQNVMIALPGELNAKLESEVSGAKASAIIALVMLGLQTLESNGQTLKVTV